MGTNLRCPYLVLDVDAGPNIALEEGEEDRQGVHLAHGSQDQGGEEGEVGKGSSCQEEGLRALGGPAEVGEGGHQVEGVLCDAQDVIVLLYPGACNLEIPEIETGFRRPGSNLCKHSSSLSPLSLSGP